MAPFCSCPASLVSRKFFAVGPGCAKCFFFLLRSVGRRDLSAGPGQKKKTPPRVFFFAPAVGERQEKEKPRAGTGLLLPLPFPGAGAKKHTPWVVFFFLLRTQRTLTHSLRAWVAMPPPRRGGVFCCGPARTGVVFFFCCGPARTLTHSLWAGAISARPGWCFFLAAAPPGLFRQ